MLSYQPESLLFTSKFRGRHEGIVSSGAPENLGPKRADWPEELIGLSANLRKLGKQKKRLREKKEEKNGAEGDRTPDPRLAKPVLSQLSYCPTIVEVPERLIRRVQKHVSKSSSAMRSLALQSRGESLLKSSNPEISYNPSLLTLRG